jgi:hypothetical protein
MLLQVVDTVTAVSKRKLYMEQVLEALDVSRDKAKKYICDSL